MQILISLALLIVVLCTYAALFKTAAFLLRRTRLRWTHAFAFSLLMLLILLGARDSPSVLANFVPAWVFSAFGIASGIALGGWFLGTRATNANGQPIGWLGAVKLSTVALALLMIAGLAIIIVAQPFLHARHSRSIMSEGAGSRPR
jgi:hypothetical protein